MDATSDAGRYARITQRLAMAAAAHEDDSSRELAAVLERRVVDAIAADCAPHVTSDLISERLQQAIAALTRHGLVFHLETDLIINRCFCGAYACDHAAELLNRLVGAEVPIIRQTQGVSAPA